MTLELDGLTTVQICKIRTEVDKMKMENIKPKNDIDYENGYCITVGDDVKYVTHRTSWFSNEMVDNISSIGLYRDTEEECEKLFKKLQIHERLRQWSKMCKEKVDWKDRKQDKYYLFHDSQSNEIIIDYVNTSKSNDIYFTDESILRRAIEDISKQNLIDYYFVEV